MRRQGVDNDYTRDTGVSQHMLFFSIECPLLSYTSHDVSKYVIARGQASYSNSYASHTSVTF
jgi:hypothetical protein